MSWLKPIADEIVGLFIDDGPFAISILVWLLLVGLALRYLHVPAVWGASILFAGLAAILIESTLRRSR